MQIKKVMPRGLAATLSELTEIARLSPLEVFARLESSPERIYQKDAEKRLRIYGLNDLEWCPHIAQRHQGLATARE